jgi:hypothetical protein
MKLAISTLAAAAALAMAIPAAANAAPWQSINHRQANLEQRIEQGIRSGDLNRAEARRLQAQFRNLARLEAQYRRSGGGLTWAERRDLDQRFDRLSERIYAQRNDNQVRRY